MAADAITRATESPATPLGRRVSAWSALVVLVGAAGVCLSAYMNMDPDLFWHRVLGAHWVAERGFDLSPDPIAFTAGHAWFPTAWSVEVLYAGLVGLAGYPAVFALRLVLSVAFYLLLARALLRGREPLVGALVYAAVALPASLMLQDRPQTFSVVIVAAILPSVVRALDDDVLPSRLAVAAVTWAWANMHGLWVLIPGLLGLLTVVRLAERRQTWRASALTGLVALIAAGLTPVGPRLLLAPITLSGSTSAIAEWKPTHLHSPLAWGLAAVLVALMVSWGRGSTAATPRQVAFVVAVAGFGFWAFRDAVIASMLLAPMAAVALESALPRLRSHITVPRAALVVLTVPLALIAALTYVAHASLPDRMPVRIAERIAALPGDGTLRVVTPYDTTGYVREFGGDRVRLSIDGRSDRYGDARIQQEDDLQAGRRGWQRTLSRLDPDLVVASVRSPLPQLLQDRGWTEVLSADRYVLLRHP